MQQFKLLLLVFMLSTKAFAGIQTVSNISEQKVAVNVLDDESKSRVLALLNLKNLDKEFVSLPEMENEEVIGLALFQDHLLMISQWVAGGGKDPKVHQYSLKDKTWSKPVEVNCKSFDTIEIKKQALKMHCENAAAKTLKLDFKTAKPVKLVFPLEKDQAKDFAIKLSGGEMFNWSSLVVQSGKDNKKTLTASDFLKKTK